MPYQSLIPRDRIPQVLKVQVLMVGMRDDDGAGPVKVAFVRASEVGNIGSVVDCDGLETWVAGVSRGVLFWAMKGKERGARIV